MLYQKHFCYGSIASSTTTRTTTTAAAAAAAATTQPVDVEDREQQHAEEPFDYHQQQPCSGGVAAVHIKRKSGPATTATREAGPHLAGRTTNRTAVVLLVMVVFSSSMMMFLLSETTTLSGFSATQMIATLTTISYAPPPPRSTKKISSVSASSASVSTSTTRINNGGTLLSTRGRGVVRSGRDDLSFFRIGAADAYHPIDNPRGYLVMLVAENKQMLQEMARRIEDVSSFHASSLCRLRREQREEPDDSLTATTTTTIPEWTFLYGDMGGQANFKQEMAHVMNQWMTGTPPVNPNKLRFQAGAGSVLDQLSYTLADVNDGVLVTTPHYSAFGPDFAVYGQVQLHPCPTQDARAPTVAELDACYDGAVAAGNPPKIFIICQPNNPTGIIYSYKIMHRMITWALKRGLHVVSDEIYALSVFPGQKMISAAHIMADLNAAGADDDDDDPDHFLGDRVHIVAGLSKDWGMSGFRVGSLYSHNVQLLTALDRLGYYQSTSQYTQWVLTQVFADHKWVDWYIGENQQRLSANYQALRAALAAADVPLVYEAQGGLFAWADFSSFLREGQTERDLWIELFDGPRIALTAGESCHGAKPGLFRIVYAWPEGGVAAMDELGARLVKWKTERDER